MGDLIKKIGLTHTSKSRPGRKKVIEKKEAEVCPQKDSISIGQDLCHVPSANIHTHRANVLSKITVNTDSKPKKESSPKFITLFEEEIMSDGKSDKSVMGTIWQIFSGEKEYNENVTNTDINQTEYMKDLTGKLGPLARIQNQQDISKLNGRIPSVKELNDEFQKLAGDSTIPYEYIVDGCYARAHLMCDQMMKDNINCSKMFVMIENLFGGGMLKAENKFMKAEWWYHVAPITFAKDEKTDKIEGYIMDPGMSNKPMKADEWINAMWDKSYKIKIDVARAPQYSPLESGGENVTFEECLPHAKKTAEEYSKVLEQIKEDYYALHPDDKPDDKNLT